MRSDEQCLLNKCLQNTEMSQRFADLFSCQWSRNTAHLHYSHHMRSPLMMRDFASDPSWSLVESNWSDKLDVIMARRALSVWWICTKRFATGAYRGYIFIRRCSCSAPRMAQAGAGGSQARAGEDRGDIYQMVLMQRLGRVHHEQGEAEEARPGASWLSWLPYSTYL